MLLQKCLLDKVNIQVLCNSLFCSHIVISSFNDTSFSLIAGGQLGSVSTSKILLVLVLHTRQHSMTIVGNLLLLMIIIGKHE